jgi:threonyl-tRNA synthetase
VQALQALVKAEDVNSLESRPMMIHRAILGSMERFITIITEHFAEKWCISSALGAGGGFF